MKNRWTKAHMGRGLFCVAMACVLIVSLYSPAVGLPPVSVQDFMNGTAHDRMEIHVSNNLPYLEQLQQISLQISMLGGRQEQNSIFISREGLIRNVAQPVDVLVRENTDAISRFSQQAPAPVYVVLIPTASAILQQYLPSYAQIHFNQKRMIDDVYRDLSGSAVTIDVYSTLFYHREEYIYYRTESNLTSTGGFYLFSALGTRLGLEGIDPTNYNIEYIDNSYYGDLFQSSPWPEVRADLVAVYHYNRYDREYVVTHTDYSGFRMMHTLYPTWSVALDRSMDVFLGGTSAITEIYSSAPYDRSILVFGDKTTRSYLGFLADYYNHITLVDLFRLSSQQAEEIDLNDYSQILFAYSVESFDTSVPMRAERLLQQ